MYVCVRVCVDTMCQERTQYMYSPYQERTSNQEQTHSMSAVGFGIRFRLLILENPGIEFKIMGEPESAFGIEIISRIILTMNESPLLVKTSHTPIRSWSKPHTFQSALCMLSADHLNVDGPPFPVKCVGKFRYALGGEVTYRVCVCVWGEGG